MANKYGVSSLPADYDNTHPSSGQYNDFRINNHAPVYVVNGNLTTQGNWNVNGNGSNPEKPVIFVDGTLTIDGNINITGKGFIAFIVNGSIVVTSNVGSNLNNDTNPDIEGVYITNNKAGTVFDTGQTTGMGKARLVLKGIFLAHDFRLQRDLNTAQAGANVDHPGEKFIYNPMLLFTMPPEFQDVHVKWQEVAP
jgi:hypothetical protein